MRQLIRTSNRDVFRWIGFFVAIVIGTYLILRALPEWAGLILGGTGWLMVAYWLMPERK